MTLAQMMGVKGIEVTILAIYVKLSRGLLMSQETGSTIRRLQGTCGKHNEIRLPETMKIVEETTTAEQVHLKPSDKTNSPARDRPHLQTADLTPMKVVTKAATDKMICQAPDRHHPNMVNRHLMKVAMKIVICKDPNEGVRNLPKDMRMIEERIFLDVDHLVHLDIVTQKLDKSRLEDMREEIDTQMRQKMTMALHPDTTVMPKGYHGNQTRGVDTGPEIRLAESRETQRALRQMIPTLSIGALNQIVPLENVIDTTTEAAMA